MDTINTKSGIKPHESIKRNVMQAVDWSRFDLEGWLYQFGAWQYTGVSSRGHSNPIAVSMEQARKKRKVRLTAIQKKSIIAGYFTSDIEPLQTERTKVVCDIGDDEARAVQRLVLDLMGSSEILDGWMDAIIIRYFYGNSWAQMVGPDRTAMDAKFDVRCGLAALHARYTFIKMSKN